MTNHRSRPAVEIAIQEFFMPLPAVATAAASTTNRFGTMETNGRDMALLRNHVQRCDQAQGRWADMQIAAMHIHQFFAPRFATTLAVLLAVVASVAMAV